jgi:hypothetical protein
MDFAAILGILIGIGFYLMYLAEQNKKRKNG